MNFNNFPLILGGIAIICLILGFIILFIGMISSYVLYKPFGLKLIKPGAFLCSSSAFFALIAGKQYLLASIGLVFSAIVIKNKIKK